MNDINEQYLNGEMTTDADETKDVFDAWEEQKHPRNHGKFAKKGEGVTVSWNDFSDDYAKKHNNIDLDPLVPYLAGLFKVSDDKIKEILIGTKGVWKNQDDLNNKIRAALGANKGDKKGEGKVRKGDNDFLFTVYKTIHRFPDEHLAEAKDVELKTALTSFSDNVKKLEKIFGVDGKDVKGSPFEKKALFSIRESKRAVDAIKAELKKRGEGSGAVAKFRIKKLDGLGKWSVEPNLSKFGENQKENLARIEKERKLFNTEAEAKAYLSKVESGKSKSSFADMAKSFSDEQLTNLLSEKGKANIEKYGFGGENQKEIMAALEAEMEKRVQKEADENSKLQMKHHAIKNGSLNRSDISVSSLKDGVATAFAPEGVNVDQDVRKKMIAAVMEKHPGKKFTFSKVKNDGIEGVKAVEIKGEGATTSRGNFKENGEIEKKI